MALDSLPEIARALRIRVALLVCTGADAVPKDRVLPMLSTRLRRCWRVSAALKVADLVDTLYLPDLSRVELTRRLLDLNLAARQLADLLAAVPAILGEMETV